MLNLILFGPPGSGKGTQSKLIIDRFGLHHISTGDLLRGEISEGTQLGKEAKAFINKGELVPDKVVIGMIKGVLEKNTQAKGFIFDGFPRTKAQAAALDKLLKEKETEIALVLALKVPEKELVKRLLLRGKTSGRTDDANEEIIKARIQEYHDKTEIVAQHYKELDKFAAVKGDGTIEETSALLSELITPLAKEIA